METTGRMCRENRQFFFLFSEAPEVGEPIAFSFFLACNTQKIHQFL
jgi:hypothetical protein